MSDVTPEVPSGAETETADPAATPAAPAADPAVPGTEPSQTGADAPDPVGTETVGTETVDDTGQGPNIAQSAPPEPPPAPAGETDSHTFTVAQTVGTSYSSTGVSGTVVKLEADAGAKVDSIMVTVAADIAHLFEVGEKWILTRLGKG